MVLPHRAREALVKDSLVKWRRQYGSVGPRGTSSLSYGLELPIIGHLLNQAGIDGLSGRLLTGSLLVLPVAAVVAAAVERFAQEGRLVVC